MNRKELYSKIAELKLQEEVKKACGRNYTQVPNSVLEEMVNKTVAALSIPSIAASTHICNKRDSKFEKLIKILSRKRILLSSEVKSIME